MSAAQLPVDGHVLSILRTHTELAAHDAAHAEDGNGSLGARYNLWQACVDHVEMLADDAYARDFYDRVMRRAAAKAAYCDVVDAPAVAGALARVQEAIAGLTRLADLVQARPEIAGIVDVRLAERTTSDPTRLHVYLGAYAGDGSGVGADIASLASDALAHGAVLGIDRTERWGAVTARFGLAELYLYAPAEQAGITPSMTVDDLLATSPEAPARATETKVSTLANDKRPPTQTWTLPVYGAKTRAEILADAAGFDLDDVVNVSDPQHEYFGARGTVTVVRSDGLITVRFTEDGDLLTLPGASLMHHTKFVAQMDEAERRAAKDAEAADDAWSASEQFEHDQASEAAADYAASLEPGIEADL